MHQYTYIERMRQASDNLIRWCHNNRSHALFWTVFNKADSLDGIVEAYWIGEK